MEKTKLLTFAVVALLLLNLGTLTFLVLHRPHPGMWPHERGEKGPADYIIRELNFNENQKTQFMKLVDAHRKSINELQKTERENHEKLFDALESSDTVFVNTAIHAIGDTQSETAKITFMHFKDVRALCTPEQQTKFKSIINAALHMMSPPPGH